VKLQDKLQDIIQAQIDSNSLYTTAQKDIFFQSDLYHNTRHLIDEGEIWFYPIIYNQNGIGDKTGTTSFCDQWAFAVRINGEWYDGNNLNRIWNMRAFL